MAKYTKPEHIKNIIDDIISRIKEKEGKNKTGEIGKYITKILGKQSEEHVKVSGFKKGSLYIKVTNSAWLQELSLMKQDLVNSINEELKNNLVREIKIELTKRRRF